MLTTSGGTPVRRLYDPAAGLPMVLDDGTRKYVYGPQGLAYAEGPDGLEVFHTDELGSVRAVSDGTARVVRRRDAGGEERRGRDTDSVPP